VKREVLVFLVVGGFFSLLAYIRPGFLETLVLRVEDTKFSVRSLLGADLTPSDRVVVVAIDEKSVNELGRWPWSRIYIARMIDRLSQAKVVALDIVFSEREAPTPDRLLAESMRRHGRVITGFFLREESTQREEETSLRLLRESEFLRFKLLSEKVGLLEIPYAEVSLPRFGASSLAMGYLNAEPDRDGIYRKYTIAHLFRGGLYLPLALQALRFYEGKDFYMEISERGVEKFLYRGEDVPIHEGRFHRINFYPGGGITIVSAVDVIKGRVEEDFFKDKAVFVGATEVGIYDLRPTPVDPVMPGVLLHAYTFSNFYEGHFIRSYPFISAVLTFLLAGIPVYAHRLREIKGRLVLYGSLLTSYLALSYLGFAYLSLDLNLFYPVVSLAVSIALYEGIKVFLVEKDIRELRRAFRSYVSPQILEVITRHPESLKLGGERREITVLFSDIRGFTGLSEKLKPEELVNLLNAFLTPMTEIVLRRGGMLDKYIGDAIMAVFNAPVDTPNHTENACRCALEMVSTLEELNPRFKELYGVELDIGVGINTGEAVVGNMGSSVRFDYTAIGDTVNSASRLEGLNKLYGTKILISENTRERIGGLFLTRKLDVVVLKGKQRAMTVYELLRDTERNRALVSLFEKALDKYMEGDFGSAELLFEEVSIRFGDRASGVFARRCRELLKKPPKEWRGVYVVQEK